MPRVDPQIIELLCQHGADPCSVDENGWSALHYAAACSSGLAALHFLCEVVPELIDAQCSEGNTALHVASACGCIDNVRALLETAASPVMANACGQTPYRLALQSNKIQCALVINEYQQPALEPLESGNKHRPLVFDGDEFVKPKAGVGAVIGPLYDMDAVREAEVPVRVESAVVEVRDDWVECETEDGLPYVYNTATGVSAWFKPTASAQSSFEVWGGEEDTTSLNTFEATAERPLGQELPLCLIPMVSPLTSLDDPTAAAKLAAQRRKARENRRKRFRQQERGRKMNM